MEKVLVLLQCPGKWPLSDYSRRFQSVLGCSFSHEWNFLRVLYPLHLEFHVNVGAHLQSLHIAVKMCLNMDCLF